MADWAIGDLHGCLDEFDALLRLIEFDPTSDTLWLTGDLVNRGPKCLATLRRVKALSTQMGSRLTVVLGNHDLHLLACWSGMRSLSASDTLESILTASDADTLCEWLRRQPIAHVDGNHILVHAGLYPGLSLEKNLALADTLASGLRGEHFHDTLRAVYTKPVTRNSRFSDDVGQINFAAATFTRMRCLEPDLDLNLREKQGLDSLPTGVRPWFELAPESFHGVRIHTGHWAALGYGVFGPVIALDGGCVWGGELIAVDRRKPDRPYRVERGSLQS